jgi:ABC-type Fe3+ transport system substrate-binding protein
VAINARSKHLAAAESFVNYILSQTGQHVMIHDPNDSDSFYTPIIKGVSALPGVKIQGSCCIL